MGQSQVTSGKKVKRIAIIGGGGPAGLATLRVFREHISQLDADETWDIVAFEAREDIGGVWFRSSATPPDSNEPPPSAIYDCLMINIPHPTMSLHNFPFPPSTYLFPNADVVIDYIHSYADHFNVRQYIKLNHKVTRAEWDNSKSEWTLNLSTGETWKGDHVIVASGHYHFPRIPSTITGLKEFKNVIHSAWYRNATPFKDKKVVVVGGGPSGRDITADLVGSASEVLWCVRTHTRSDKVENGLKKRVALKGVEVDGKVTYEDGTSDENVDWVILATGYEFNYSFLPQIVEAFPPSGVLFPPALHNSKYHLYPLAQHLFPLPPPPSQTTTSPAIPPSAIAFIGLPSRLSPVPICEVQALAAIRLFQSASDPSLVDLDTQRRKLLERRNQILTSNPNAPEEEILAKLWHKMPDLEQYEYRKELVAFAAGYDEDKIKELEQRGWKFEDWVVEAYMNKDVLRAEWRDVEACGEADEYVRGVGTSEGWIKLMNRLLERAKRRKGELAILEEVASSNVMYTSP
ncbi:hypothetical protein FRC03_010520 [Tulasnella sp. 419]|nr:hypothetical protein FRC03_010520 [Tulasnella sp. 419]